MKESAPTKILLELFCLWISSVHAFAPEVPSHFARSRSPAIFHARINRQASLLQQQQQLSSSSLFLSGDAGGGQAPKRRRKRVKRKEAFVEEVVEEEQVEEPKPREDGPVNLQVQDVRSLVGGGGAAEPKVSQPSTASSSSTRSSEASSPKISAPSELSSSSSNGDSLSPDSLQMLLEDAKEFQAMEEKKESSVASMGEEEEGFKLPGSFRNILSTIVTIDFFVICGFLLWFLAGIFCSYILKDDTVQIAFNQLFQPVVQPALGILMIGAIAGSFGNEEDQENV